MKIRFKRIEGSTRFERCTWKLDAPLSPLDENFENKEFYVLYFNFNLF